MTKASRDVESGANVDGLGGDKKISKNNRIIFVHPHHPVAFPPEKFPGAGMVLHGHVRLDRKVLSMCWGREALLNFADLQYQVWTPIRVW